MSEQPLTVMGYAEEKGVQFKMQVRGREWCGRCPNPQCSSRTDAFSVLPDGRDYGQWAGRGAWRCRKCWASDEMITTRQGVQRQRRCGSIADLVMIVEGISYREAVAYIAARDEGTDYTPDTHVVPTAQPVQQYARLSDEEWIAKQGDYLRKSRLIRDQAEKQRVLDYIASRGLTVETANHAKLGYSCDTVKLETGDYRDIPFLVIPWYEDYTDGTLYRKVNRRNLHSPKPDDEPKYKAMYGSGNDALYLGGFLLHEKMPTFLVESELDALTIKQEAGDLVHVVATGSAKAARNRGNEARLRRQPFVFVSFDDDESGNEASTYWLSKLDASKSTRYRPLMHDANEMHTHGSPVREWVLNALYLFTPAIDSTQQATPVHSVQPVETMPSNVLPFPAPVDYQQRKAQLEQQRLKQEQRKQRQALDFAISHRRDHEKYRDDIYKNTAHLRNGYPVPEVKQDENGRYIVPMPVGYDASKSPTGRPQKQEQGQEERTVVYAD